jgi:hypothetical protein
VITLQQGVELAIAALRYTREQKLRKILVIATGVTGFPSPSLADRFFLVRKWAEVAGTTLRVAIVVPPEWMDAQKFGVTVARNLGLQLESFTDEAAARAWLNGA